MSSSISDSTDVDSTITHHSRAAANTLSLLNTPNSPLGQKSGSATFKVRLYVTAGVPFYRNRQNTSTMLCQVLALKCCSGSRCRDKTECTLTRTDTRFLPSTSARPTKGRVYQGADTVPCPTGVGSQKRSVALSLATGLTLATSSSRLRL